MVIQIDSREKPKAITKILSEFNRQGVKYYVSKLFAGDYMSMDNPKLVIDRKQNLSEICMNVGSSEEEHIRFRNELIRANDVGIKIIVLIEHGHGYKRLEDVQFWENPRLKQYPRATSGPKLYKIMKTMQQKYNVEFMFCEKDETGRKILELLG